MPHRTWVSNSKIPVEYVCFLNQTGYGQAASSNVFSLDDSGLFDIRAHCLHGRPPKEAFDEKQHSRLTAMMTKEPNPKAIQVFQTIPAHHKRVRGLKKKIALVTFETHNPPEEWIDLLNRCDAVFVPSMFNYNSFLRTSLKRPLFYIPHVINMNIWNDSVVPLKEHEEFTFIFSGTWKKRKGWDILAEAWMEEFSPDEKVKLIIKTDHSDKAQKDIISVKRNLNRKETAPIFFERKVFNEYGMAQFLKSADCYIAPTLGEGFGLLGLQSMALRVPLIVTNFSGCKDYAFENNCTLLEPSGFMVNDCLDPVPQYRYKKWPRIKIDTIRKAMRNVFNDYKTAQSKADLAYDFVHSNFGYERFSKEFLDMVESVYGWQNISK